MYTLTAPNFRSDLDAALSVIAAYYRITQRTAQGLYAGDLADVWQEGLTQREWLEAAGFRFSNVISRFAA